MRCEALHVHDLSTTGPLRPQRVGRSWRRIASCGPPLRRTFPRQSYCPRTRSARRPSARPAASPAPVACNGPSQSRRIIWRSGLRWRPKLRRRQKASMQPAEKGDHKSARDLLIATKVSDRRSRQRRAGEPLPSQIVGNWYPSYPEGPSRCSSPLFPAACPRTRRYAGCGQT
jgi:hypothetical protein